MVEVVAVALVIQVVLAVIMVAMVSRTLAVVAAAAVVAVLHLAERVVTWVKQVKTLLQVEVAMVQVSTVHHTSVKLAVVLEMSVVDKTIKEQLCL